MDRLLLLFASVSIAVVGCGETDRQSAQELKSKLAEVNREYPAPLLPSDTSLQQVVSVTDDGAIVLKDGRNIRLEGIDCKYDIANNLRRLFSDNRIKVIVKASNGGADLQRYYVWYTFAELLNLVKHQEIPAMSINEMFVMTENCSPITSGSHPYSERYQALYELSRTIK